ncbi:MAG: LAGLIDADG family homing endonuclease [Thermoproteota archaeon]
MGSGLRVKQYARRFYEGEQAREKKEDEASRVVKTFGKYEIRTAESGGYDFLKEGRAIGMFSQAKIEEDRVIFKLSRGMNLEVSEKGIREILTLEKAELCGLTAADGTVCKYRVKRGIGHEFSLTTIDHELVGVFKELVGDTYSMTPHERTKHHKTKEGEKEHYYVAIYNKKVAYDLWDLGIKGPGPYEFHPPTRYLDDEGKRAYLRGFFSGDGNVSMTREGKHYIRIYSKYKEGLEELRKMLIDLGFHPSEIHTRDRGTIPGKFSGPEHHFSIPEEDHLKFIEEIGSEKGEHKRRFQLIKLMDEDKERRKER